MKIKNKMANRIMSILLGIALLMTCVPNTLLVASADSATATETVVDPGTAHTWETMLGTSEDGNRYAGRVWVDKSVYKNGEEALLNTSGTTESKFRVNLEDDEEFQVIFSALGSSMTSTTTKTTTSGALDIILVLDNSDSMKTTSNRITRMERVIDAANELIENILSGMDVRLGIVSYGAKANEVLPFGKYTDGVTLSVNNYSNGGVISAHNNSDRLLGKSQKGYEMNTNTQAGFEMAVDMLTSATDIAERKPVVILLTDGAANTAVTKEFYNVSDSNFRQEYSSSTIHSGIALSTLLSVAYGKASIEDYYGKAPMVFGIGVDLSSSDGSNAIINPKAAFNSSNANSNIRTAYTSFATWSQGNNVEISGSNRSTFIFDHAYPSGSTVKDSDVIANINYVDTYYDVNTVDQSVDALKKTFEQIFEELSSAAFNPISSTTTTTGGTGVDKTPLIYVDNIGQYMEIKEIQAVTLFGASYGVTNNGDGTYSVQGISGTNPTTKETYDDKDIEIKVSKNSDGTQRLEIRIQQEILPILLEQVTDKTIGSEHTATITELSYNPLRVFYTIGLNSDILLPNGEIDITMIDKDYYSKNNVNGSVAFYSNAFGEMNSVDADTNGKVDNGDAHVGFQPSLQNRYYYYQSNQGIFTEVKSNGNAVNIAPNNMYGIVWKEDTYDLTWMTYQNYIDYLQGADDRQVYTYVTFYHPTSSETDAANVAEKVTYLVYMDWKYLKESVAFYDAASEKYINYKDGQYSLDDVGYAMDSYDIANYVANNNNASNIYAVLAVGAQRTSRFHNMIALKEANATGTADNRYVPEYTHQTSESENNHYGNDVVVWLGNNGKLTKKIDTGIALTKAVTEAIGGVEDTYELTVTVENTTAYPVVKDINGNVFGTTDPSDDDKVAYDNNILTVKLKAGEKVYISGIPTGTECTIGEIIPNSAEYHISNKTSTVKVPTIAEVLAETNPVAQYVDATVTNAPNKYGDLTIVKDISYVGTLTSEMQSVLAAKVFTFTVNVDAALEGKTFDTYNTAGVKNDTGVTIVNGKFTVALKDNESITIKDLPEGTTYTVTETDANGLTLTNLDGEVVTNNVVSGTIALNDNDTAHFVNTYNPPTKSTTIEVSGTKTLLGKSYDAQEFDFAVQKWNGSAYETVTGATSILNFDVWSTGESESKNYQITLNTGDIALGTHYYRVVEKLPGTPVVGMDYDSSAGHFRITVVDKNVDGIAEVKVEQYVNDAWETININNDNKYAYSKDFTNTYTTVSASVTIPFIKSVTNNTGVDISQSEFAFCLTEVDADGTTKGNSSQEIFAEAGDAHFTINYNAEGVYYYHLTEQIGSLAGMTYDRTTYLVTVTVSKKTEDSNVLTAAYTMHKVKDENGNVLPTPEAVKLDKVSFENKYQLSSATWTPEGIKKLEGRTLNDREFSFELYETDESFLITGAALDEQVNLDSDNDGKNIEFEPIEFTQVGTYYYSLKEVIPSENERLGGITYDTTHYHITVPVIVGTGADADKLVVDTNNISINKIGINSDTTGNVVFVNTYDVSPKTYTINGTKILTGRAMQKDEFIFNLYEIKDEVSTLIDTSKNHTDGSFEFGDITYDTAGVYNYYVEEVIGDIPGVYYDGNKYYFTVTVTDNNDGTLSVTSDIERTPLVIENIYTASPVNVSFDGKKNFDGDSLVGSDFTFKLYETDHDFGIESNKLMDTKTNDVNGAFIFNAIKYEHGEVGTYFYSIVEDATNPKENVVYDSTQHNFRVQVSDDGTGQLKAEVLNVNTGEVTVSSQVENSSEFLAKESVIFTNATFSKAAEKEVYLSSDTTTVIDGQQVSVGDVLTYYITYTNYTGEHVVVDIMDTIPAYTSYVEGSASHNGTYAGAHLNWILDVHKGESVTVSFQVKVEEAEAIMTNSAVIFDGTNVYTTKVVKNHSIEDIVKKDVVLSDDPTVSIDGSQIFEGTELMYTIRYSNLTDIPVEVTIKDTIPAHTTYVEGSVDSNGTYANGELEWDLTVGAWESVLVSFKVMVVDEEVDVINKAYVLEGNNTYTSNEVKNYVNASSVPVDPIPEPTPVPTPDPTPDPGEDDGRIYKSFVFTKVWNDNNDKLGKRPDSITVELYQDGVYVTDVILSKENGWTDTAILMYSKDDHVYEWTMKEKNVPAGYVASYKQSECTVINTLKELSTVTNGPGTGDDSNLGFFLGAAAVSLIAIIGLVVLMKFRKKDDE